MNAHQPYTFVLLGTTYQANTLAEASAAFSATRDATGLGSSDMPLPHIEQGGAVVGHFSYNGRIWAKPSSDWKAGDEAIFSPSYSVQQAIDLHRIAVLVDEQSYDSDCNAILQSLADATGQVEAEAFIALAKAPCADDAEVQVKLAYFLNEQIGERSLPVECLGHEEYGGFDVFNDFVKSLLLQEASR